MIVNGYEILQDGETVVVGKIGTNGKTGKKTFTAVAYVRDLKSGLEAVQRRLSASALSKEKTASKIIKLLTKQHEEMLEAVGKVKIFGKLKRDIK